MCGIAGIFSHSESAAPVDRDELLRLREAMAKRGPDGAGLWIAESHRAGLVHRRLAIIDLSESGSQPMAAADGRFHITFNGEIYNYRELRLQLEQRGYAFRSNSDTEVLLHLYADRGREMVHALRGMFAFAIWDDANQELFLARDPLGIKPLYYADDGNTFRFATLVGALVESGGVDTTEDIAGIASFYLWGCVREPFTFYRSIRALPAGSTMRVTRSGVEAPSSYFTVLDEFRKAEAAPVSLSQGEILETIRETMRESMRYHMVSDVPVGVFLSAGVDSNVLATLGAELNPGKLHALTLGFQEYKGTRDDETVFAEESARLLGIAQSTRWISRSDFHGEWQRFFSAMDQPSTDGVNTYLVAKAAAECGMKVAVSGLGGDELVGGYPSFRDVPRIRRWVPRMPAAGRWVRALSSPLLGAVTSPKYAGIVEYGAGYAGAYLLRRALHMPWELARLLGRKQAADALARLQPLAALEASIRDLKNERCIVAALELQWYMRNQLLRDSDWAGMYHGVEIRVPFVDVAVLRALAPLIAGTNPPTKAQLAAAVVNPLSGKLVSRRKTGFSVPVRDWLRSEMPSMSRERGLRGWSRVIARLKGGRRFLALVTDGFGGHGGIALYNRDLLQALCAYRGGAGAVAIPRHMPNPPERMPDKLTWVDAGVGGKRRYLVAALRRLRDDRRFDVVVCGHINLLPLAWLASRLLKAPMILFVYGIDAWQPTRSRIVNALARQAAWVVSISGTTAVKFRSWADEPAQQVLVLPNAIHAEWYGPGEKSPELLDRYGLRGKTVIMTLGRLVSAERYKGFDEVLEILPQLAQEVPGIAYLIVGSGSDRTRLERKAGALGIADRVVFTGLIPETEKADHYRLADAYVMASRGEGFGFVLLEAMACGIPVIASCVDGGREAVRDGELGMLVDPSDREALKLAILESFKRERGVVPPGLEHFSFQNFESRLHAIVDRVLDEAGSSPGVG